MGDLELVHGGVLMIYISAFCGIGKLRIEECERRVIDYVLSTNLVCVFFCFFFQMASPKLTLLPQHSFKDLQFPWSPKVFPNPFQKRMTSHKLLLLYPLYVVWTIIQKPRAGSFPRRLLSRYLDPSIAPFPPSPVSFVGGNLSHS